MWDLIVSVPDHCLSFYFNVSSVGLKEREIDHRIAGLAR